MSNTQKDLRIGWVGFHSEGIPAFAWLLEHGPAPEILITLNESAAQKRSAEDRNTYLQLCRDNDIPFLEVANVNDEESITALRNANLDLLVVLGWSQILRSDALRVARIGVVGAHASLLPHNRGSAPINWAIINGEKQAGNTLMWLDEDVDSGDIIDQVAFEISLFDTCDTMYDKVAISNRDMIARLLERLAAGELPRNKQDFTSEKLLPRRRPSDGLIAWDANNESVYNFVRALTKPYPGAFTYLDGDCITVWRLALLSGTARTGVPGEILGPVFSPVSQACGLEVACGNGSVILLEIEDQTGAVITGPKLSLLDWKKKVFSNE